MSELTKADEIMIEMDCLNEDLESLYTVRVQRLMAFRKLL